MINRFTAYDSPDEVKYIYPHEMNTGDLVCVSYSNFASAFVGTFTNSIWVHVGIIWVDPNTNVRYVLEGAIYNGIYKNFFKIQLDIWMFINKKNLMCWNKYNGPTIDAEHMMNQFEQFIKYSKLEGLNMNWYRFLLVQDYTEHVHKSKYTCFEAIVILGQEIGIFDKSRKYCSYFPSDLANNRIKLCPGVSYNKKIQIRMTDCQRKMLFDDMVQFSEFWQK